MQSMRSPSMRNGFTYQRWAGALCHAKLIQGRGTHAAAMSKINLMLICCNDKVWLHGLLEHGLQSNTNLILMYKIVIMKNKDLSTQRTRGNQSTVDETGGEGVEAPVPNIGLFLQVTLQRNFCRCARPNLYHEIGKHGEQRRGAEIASGKYQNESSLPPPSPPTQTRGDPRKPQEVSDCAC
ncbi:hypothetical protein ACHAWF_003365, partial [Thalassiosira exigua]